MNKSLFSCRLFREGLRQTRVMGIISLIVILGLTGLIWLGCFTSSSFMWNDRIGGSEILYGVEVASVLILQYCLMSPLMVLFLFRFLNRRDASDVYHALPYSRECVTLSYFASIMTWNAIVTVGTLVMVIPLYSLFDGMLLNISQVLCFGLNIFMAQFTVGAGVLFAMGITGTTFSNISVSLLVLFLPRLVLIALSKMMNQVCVVVDVTEQFSFFNPALNVVAGIPFTILDVLTNGDGLLDCLTNPINGLYTLVLGVVFLLAAIWVLRNRKSETAGKSSPGKVLQGVYRVAVGSVLGMLPMYLVFLRLMDEDAQGFSQWVVVLILLFFVALGYFLFELLTTKKVKNVIKAIPTFGLVLVCNGLFLAMVFGLSNGLLNYLPKAEAIKEFYILPEYQGQYFVAQSQTVSITDQSAKNLISDELKRTVGMVEQGLVHRDRYHFYGPYEGENYKTMKVCIRGKWGKQYRYILVTHENYEYLMGILEQQEEYKTILYDLPTPKTHTMTLRVTGYGAYQPTKEQTLQMYNVLLQEVANMPLEQWYPIAMGNINNGKSCAFSITATVEMKGETYTILFPITRPLFPKTFDAYLECYNRDNPNGLDKFKTNLADVASHGTVGSDFDITATILHPIERYMKSQEDWMGAVQAVLEHAKPYTPGTDDLVVEMTLQEYSQYDSSVGFPRTTVIFTVEREYIAPYLHDAYVYYEDDFFYAE